jgi:hypothetical protein
MLEFLIDSIFVEIGGHNINKSSTSLWEQIETGFIKDKTITEAK